jgi:methylglyoxal synthase
MSDFVDANELIDVTPATKRVALIAHDGRKVDLVSWATFNRETLARFFLVATRNTARLLQRKVELPVGELLAGSVGGDMQIATRVVQGEVDTVLFLADPISRQPHEPDIHPVHRVCNVHNVPFATNLATAGMIIDAFARLDELTPHIIGSKR